LDYNTVLQEYSKKLKEEHKCDLIVALNHMRVPDDNKMAETNNTDVLDLIFGGHDHSYVAELKQETGVYVLKSGTDFEVFTNFTVLFDVAQDDYNTYYESIKDKLDENLVVSYCPKNKRVFISEKVPITAQFDPDQEMVEHIKHYTDQLKAIQQVPAGFSGVDLEARFSRVRTEETNLGNMVADIIRSEYNCDFGILNGGCLRANGVFDKGVIKNLFIG
jgi:5'-nucleotidase